MYDTENKNLTRHEKLKEFWNKNGAFCVAVGVLLLMAAADEHAVKRCARRYASMIAMGHITGVLKFDPPKLIEFMEGLTPRDLDKFWKEYRKIKKK